MRVLNVVIVAFLTRVFERCAKRHHETAQDREQSSHQVHFTSQTSSSGFSILASAFPSVHNSRLGINRLKHWNIRYGGVHHLFRRNHSVCLFPVHTQSMYAVLQTPRSMSDLQLWPRNPTKNYSTRENSPTPNLEYVFQNQCGICVDVCFVRRLSHRNTIRSLEV